MRDHHTTAKNISARLPKKKKNASELFNVAHSSQEHSRSGTRRAVILPALSFPQWPSSVRAVEGLSACITVRKAGTTHLPIKLN